MCVRVFVHLYAYFLLEDALAVKINKHIIYD